MGENEKQILDRWATAVVPKEAIFLNKQNQPQVNQNKLAHYEERGYKGDEVLWIAPKDSLRAEFEDAPQHNHRYILEMESAAKSLGFEYCITGHKGKSDYFNIFNIKAMPLGEDNKAAKLLLADELMAAIAKDQLDRTNLGWTLSPVIGHPHWKPKYHGEIHTILRGKNPLEHKNKYPSRLLTKIKKAKEWHKKNKGKWKGSDNWVDDFLINFCCNNKLPEGSRHFIIEKNLAAFLIFRKDRDLVKESYYQAQGRQHDSMRTWELAILKGDFKEVSPGELAKYIKDHSLEFDLPKLEKKIDESDKKEKDDYISTSLVIDEKNKMMAEQIKNDDHNRFCIYTEGEIKYQDELNSNSIIYKPIVAEEVIKGAILLPSKAEEYESDEKLDEDLKKFITRWLDIPDDVLQFAIWNIKRSWVYERFHTLNYLRALGDTGQGKSRFLDALGSIHYKPIATSGATTSAPVFRIIEKWKGTLIMDEADFQKSDEAQDMIKIINQGYERGKYVMRCDRDKNDKINFFDPFCPKILATRKTFYDKAVESRCITQVMVGTRRKDIPWNLNKEFFDNAQKLRNKLLMWRFNNYFKIDPDKKIDFNLGDLEPRVQQIVASFISLFGEDKAQLERFKVFITKYQEDLIDERRTSFAGQIVGGIHKLLEDGQTDINSQDIITAGGITDSKGQPFKPRGISSTLKTLGFEKGKQKKVDGINKRCIPLDKDHLTHLFARYGNEVTVVTAVGGIGENLVNIHSNGKTEKQKDLGSHRIRRYNRYSDTEEPITEVEQIVETPKNPLLLPIIKDMAKSGGKLLNIQDIASEARTKGISTDTFEQMISILLKEGEIFEPNPGFIQLL